MESFGSCVLLTEFFVAVSETLRDEYRQREKLIKISWFSETNHFIVCQLPVFTEKQHPGEPQGVKNVKE